MPDAQSLRGNTDTNNCKVYPGRPGWPLTRRLMSNGDKSRVREGVPDPGYSLGTDPELRAWGMLMA